MAQEVRYICTGTCQARVSEEEYNSGTKVCGTAGCTKESQPFEKRYYCTVHQTEYIEDQKSQHQGH